MYSTFFATAIIALLFFLAIQLIRMNIYLIKLKKDKMLILTRIKEDNEWEFIKGLY